MPLLNIDALPLLNIDAFAKHRLFISFETNGTPYYCTTFFVHDSTSSSHFKLKMQASFPGTEIFRSPPLKISVRLLYSACNLESRIPHIILWILVHKINVNNYLDIKTFLRNFDDTKLKCIGEYLIYPKGLKTRVRLFTNNINLWPQPLSLEKALSWSNKNLLQPHIQLLAITALHEKWALAYGACSLWCSVRSHFCHTSTITTKPWNFHLILISISHGSEWSIGSLPVTRRPV